MLSRVYPLLLLLLLALNSHCFAQNNFAKSAALPGWVEKITPSYVFEDTAGNSSGYYYLLIDRQINLKTNGHFQHIAVKILNSEGIQEMSDLSIDFDPSYQKLVFHRISVNRNGKETDRLKQQEIRLVQRETNMDRHMYDGRLTAVLNLTDIREGDIIEYAYSINGDNPIFEGNYDDRYYFRFSVPLEHQFTRLIVPDDRELHFRNLNGADQPQVRQSNGYKSYIWESKNLKSLLYDINTSAWFDPYPNVIVSEYDSWAKVANQYGKWYTIDESEKKKLQANVRDLAQNPDSAIIKSIRFVQDEIRYLGFEDGLNSHKPDRPLKVLNQRYGDCKAKSFLLCEMLKTFGIDAAPVLVHTNNGPGIGDQLPTPNAFNHCIVQITRNEKTYYIDPTISNQGGDLEHYYCPDYKKGLVLRKGTTDLADIPFLDYSKTKVTETFEMQETGKGAKLLVTTVYCGGDADSQRGIFNSSSLESIQKEYTDFYSRLYPLIRASEEIKITDNREGINEFIIHEVYTIDTIWEKSAEKEELLMASFYPLSLESYISGKKSPVRTMPYHVNYPFDFEHKTIISLPEGWNIKNEVKSIYDPSFIYEYNVSYADNKIELSHWYRTLNNSISADKVESFIAKHNEIVNNLSYVLTYDKSMLGKGFKFSWIAGFTALATLLFCLFYAVRIFNKYDVATNYEPKDSLQIGGWLILIGIGLAISPFRILFGLIKAPEFFNSHIWNALIPVYGNNKGLLLGVLMAVELIYNITLQVFIILTAILFIKRRTIFPKFAIILYVTVFAVGLLDYLATNGINPTALSESDKQEFYKNIIRSLITAAIWVPYLLLSERVKQTFVFRKSGNSTKIPSHIFITHNS